MSPLAVVALVLLGSCLAVLGVLVRRGRRVMRAQVLAGAGTPDAVASLRELARLQPKSCRFFLAHGLNALASHQTASGLHAEALASQLEATALLRTVVERVPQVEGNLALFLSNLAGKHQLHEQVELGELAAREAVAIRRRGLATDPEGAVHLAMSLNSLAQVADDAQALASSTEALALLRAALPSRLRQQSMATALACQCNAQLALGRPGTPLGDLQEIVSIRRALARDEPASSKALMGAALHDLGREQLTLGQHEQAVVTLTEAATILRGSDGNEPRASAEFLQACESRLAEAQAKRPPAPRTA